MKFAIRDDDLNYFTTPEEVRKWYADLFAEGVPVGFAAIPFIQPSGDAYPFSSPEADELYPIHKNSALCAFVKGEPCMDILQHGSTHATERGAFEYARSMPLDHTAKGREELESAFSRPITVFVPPHDWIGVSGIRSVEHAGMDIIRGRGAGLRAVLLRPAYILNFVRMALFKFVHALRGAVPAYPFMLHFGKHREICSYRLEDEDVFSGLEYARRKDGIFIVVVHIHFYTSEKKERLLALIAKAQEYGAEIVPPSSLFAV